MPELPEVEVLVRQLDPLLRGRRIRRVKVVRPKIAQPTPVAQFNALAGARFERVSRRGKYILFELSSRNRDCPSLLVGHLGMTGRMYLSAGVLPKHAAAVLYLDRGRFVFEDTRYFGRLTLDTTAVSKLGIEPLSRAFTPERLKASLAKSRQPIKTKLLDQAIIAGVGNIYASEALYRAGISPFLPARALTAAQAKRLCEAIRATLRLAIREGSTVPLNFSGTKSKDRLFYFGTSPTANRFYEERLRVYDREGKLCGTCGTAIVRVVQAARSTFYCPRCQATPRGRKRRAAE